MKEIADRLDIQEYRTDPGNSDRVQENRHPFAADTAAATALDYSRLHEFSSIFRGVLSRVALIEVNRRGHATRIFEFALQGTEASARDDTL